MNLILIIDSCEKSLNQNILELIEKSRRSDFLFIRKNEYIKTLVSKMPQATIIDVADDYVELLDESRNNIVKFFAELPRKVFKFRGKTGVSFHNIFLDKGFSAWWLMNFADKAPDAGGIVNRLFQLDIIKKIIERTNYDLGLIHSNDANFIDSVNGVFASHRISSGSFYDRSKPCKGFIFPVNAAKAAFKLISSKILTSLLMKLRTSGTGSGSDKALLCFHSWFPAHWNDYDGKYLDKYYFDLIECIEDYSLKIKPAYLFKLKWFDKSLMKLYKSFKRVFDGGFAFDFLDRYVSVREIIKYYTLAGLTVLSLDRAFSIRANKKIFQYNKTNIFDMAYLEFRNSFLLDIPYNLVLSKAVTRYLKENKSVRGFVNFLELYAYARGFINGIKNDSELSGIKTIAFQHSTITKYNLHYNYDETEMSKEGQTGLSCLPEPDCFLLSGENSANALDAYRINPEKLFVTGSPRYDFILKFLNRTTRKKDGQFIKVLIATVSDRDESLDILNSSLESLSSYKDASMTIKTHPMCDIGSEIAAIFNASEKYKNIKYEIKKDNIYELIVSNDVLITSNSMVGLEALVLGTDVVLYGDAFKINLSPLADSLEFRDRICYSNKKFKETIDKAMAGKLEKPSPAAINKLIEDNYYKLDGRSNERILKILEEMIDGDNQNRNI